MNRRAIVLGTAAALLVAFVVGMQAYQTERTEQTTFLAQERAELFVPDHAMTYGPADARVYLVEFFDPACETCRELYLPVKDLVKAYPGKVRLVLRYAPLHPGSDTVVKMLEASKEQGLYWETLEMMFVSQSMWASHHAPQPDLLWRILPKAGVDVDRLATAMEDPAVAAAVEQDIADAATLGVRMTPEYFVNGKPLLDFGYPQLVALVEAEIATVYP